MGVATIVEFLLISSYVQAQNLRIINGTVFAANDVAVKEIEEVVLPTETVETTKIVEVIPLNTSVYDLFSEELPAPYSSEISEPIVMNATLTEPTTPASD